MINQKNEISDILKISIYYYIIVFVIISLACLIKYAIEHEKPTDKYKFVVEKVDYHKSTIYCDSFTMKSDTAIVVYIDDNKVDLYAMFNFEVEMNDRYKPIK